MDAQNESKSYLEDKALEGQAQGIDFVTLGMFIIGKAIFAKKLDDLPSIHCSLPAVTCLYTSTVDRRRGL